MRLPTDDGGELWLVVIDGVKHFIKFLREGHGDSPIGVQLFYIGRDFIVGVFVIVVMNTMFGLDEFEWSR